METSETQHIDKTGWHEITDADYEKAEMDLLREALKRSYTERFLMMTSLIKDDIKAHPEKYPYKKSGLYIGGIRWEDGDEITTGEDGLPHTVKHSLPFNFFANSNPQIKKLAPQPLPLRQISERIWYQKASNHYW